MQASISSLTRLVIVQRCIDAALHNTPDAIPARVEAILEQTAHQYDQRFVAYADCGTGGRLDAVLAKWHVARLPGAHCYEFFATPEIFHPMAQAEPGTFYLTDFLVRQFDAFFWRPMGLDRHPELLDMYFGNYTTLVYQAQIQDPALEAKAEECARRMGLTYQYRFTSYGDLAEALTSLAD